MDLVQLHVHCDALGLLTTESAGRLEEASHQLLALNPGQKSLPNPSSQGKKIALGLMLWHKYANCQS
jgi:hypothetical protein